MVCDRDVSLRVTVDLTFWGGRVLTVNQTIEAIKVHHRSCNKWFILNALHHISASTTTGHNPAGSRFPQEVNPCWIVARIQIYKAHLQQCNVSKYYTIKPLAPPLNKLLRQRRHLSYLTCLGYSLSYFFLKERT